MAQSMEETPSLLDLDPELLLCALEQLPAHSQARASQVCKLFYLLVHEISRSCAFMRSFVHAPGDRLLLLSEKLPAPPSLGICLSAEPVAVETLSQLCASLPPGAQVVGGEAGELFGTDEDGRLKSEGGLALTLARFPEARALSFSVKREQRGRRRSGLRAQQSTWRESLEAEGILDGQWKLLMLFGRHPDTDEIVAELQRRQPHAAVIGGIAVGEQLWYLKQGAVQSVDGGLVGLAFDGNVPVEAFVSRGARKLGEAFRFSEGCCEQARLGVTKLATLLDGGGEAVEPLDALRRASAEVEHGGLSLGLSRCPETDGYDLTPLDDDTIDVRARALRLPPRADGSRWSEGGGSLCFYAFDAPSCKVDIQKRLEQVRQSVNSAQKELLGALMFTCNGRDADFFGVDAFDATVFTKAFPGTPLIGMYAAGEIGPPIVADTPPARDFQVGGAQLHGFTAVLGLFIVPQRTERASQLAFADQPNVAATFEAIRAARRPQPRGAAQTPPAALNEQEVRALSAAGLRQAMAGLGLEFVPGLEKEDYIQTILAHTPPLVAAAAPPASSASLASSAAGAQSGGGWEVFD